MFYKTVYKWGRSSHKLKTGDQGAHVAGAVTAAALAVGRNAYYAGENIERAVQVAGYGAAIARGVYEYFSRTPELVQQSQSQGQMAPQYKKARLYDAYKGRRQTIPVAPTVKKYVKRCMGRLIEKKYVDGAVTFTNPGTGGAIVANLICGIQLGTSDTTRTGNTIRVTKIWLRGELQGDTTATRADSRIVCFWDRQPNGAAPSVANIMQQSNTYSPFNHDMVVGQGGSRFEIVSDKSYVWNQPVSGAATFYPRRYSFFWKGSKVIKFGGNAGTVADMVTNNFGVLMQDAGTVNDFAGYVTIEYEDA